MAQSQSRSAVPAPPRSADEAALRALAEAFFRAWVAKDIDGYLRLWAPKSPDIESRKQAMRKLFADYDQIEVKSPVIHRVTVNGEKAKLRVDVEIQAVEAPTGKPAAGFGMRRRVMECV